MYRLLPRFFILFPIPLHSLVKFAEAKRLAISPDLSRDSPLPRALPASRSRAPALCRPRAVFFSSAQPPSLAASIPLPATVPAAVGDGIHEAAARGRPRPGGLRQEIPLGGEGARCDLEAQFVACYEAALGKPMWVVSPLSLCNRDVESTASRGNMAAAGRQQAVTTWLDEQTPGSVVFVSFGSIARKFPGPLLEVGHGVVKEPEVAAPGVREWLEALEARMAGRGLVVRGWTPQLAVDGWVVWNSLQESIAHGVR
ncbi:hypothetical protein C2845_PM01G38940 [Panicum miliaceum]|uniref:Uncharacterized protein n=1 Tax=Panicum miliaceum TaxID=4540 RepID=A0A3L6TRY3_PANMI|nr:hypothetical protein C2845_PM01G38940 [Panicum miliaceum]